MTIVHYFFEFLISIEVIKVSIQKLQKLQKLQITKITKLQQLEKSVIFLYSSIHDYHTICIYWQTKQNRYFDLPHYRSDFQSLKHDAKYLECVYRSIVRLLT